MVDRSIFKGLEGVWQLEEDIKNAMLREYRRFLLIDAAVFIVGFFLIPEAVNLLPVDDKQGLTFFFRLASLVFCGLFLWAIRRSHIADLVVQVIIDQTGVTVVRNSGTYRCEWSEVKSLSVLRLGKMTSRIGFVVRPKGKLELSKCIIPMQMPIAGKIIEAAEKGGVSTRGSVTPMSH